jgi:hypothetical protein
MFVFDSDLGAKLISKITFFFSPASMARKRKARTHLKDSNVKADTASTGTPKSFIIKHGQVGSSLTQLVRDMRKVMEPNTASRLKVREVTSYRFI